MGAIACDIGEPPRKIGREDTVLQAIDQGAFTGQVVAKIILQKRRRVPSHRLQKVEDGFPEFFGRARHHRFSRLSACKTWLVLEHYPAKLYQFDGCSWASRAGAGRSTMRFIGRGPQRTLGAVVPMHASHDEPHRGPGAFTSWRRCTSSPMPGIAVRCAPSHDVKSSRSNGPIWPDNALDYGKGRRAHNDLRAAPVATEFTIERRVAWGRRNPNPGAGKHQRFKIGGVRRYRAWAWLVRPPPWPFS